MTPAITARLGALAKEKPANEAAKQFIGLGEAQRARMRAFMKKNKKPKPPKNPIFDPR